MIETESLPFQAEQNLQTELIARLEAARQQAGSNPANSLHLAEEAGKIAAQLEDRYSEAASWQIRTRAHQFQADFSSAVQAAMQALGFYRELASKTQVSEMLGLLAGIYAQMTDFQQALVYFDQQLTLLKETNDTLALAVCLTSIGGIYVSMEQYSPALERYNYALTLVQNFEKLDFNVSAFVLNSLGYAYLKLDQPEPALEYLKQAYQAVNSTVNLRRAASVSLALGETYRRLNQFESALEFLQRGYNLFQELDDKRGIVGALLEMGKLYQESKLFEQGAEYYQRGLTIAEEMDNLDGSYHLHEGLATLYEEQGNLSAALEHYKQFAQLKAEVNNRDNQRALAATETRFELEKSQQEREFFRRHNLELADLLKQLEKANTEISNLNERLQSENLRMNAELDVTRRLQQMILPSPLELEQIEGYEVATFMQPANEVGGDYYDLLWFPAVGEAMPKRLYLGIGDVTGHGLESGVIMLMVQTAFSSLLRYNHLTDLKPILATINKTVYSNTQRMGSDKNLSLSLIQLNPQNGCLTVCGQHEEIIILRNDARGIERFDTSNLGFSVGLLDEIEEFIFQEELQLTSGEVAVFFTDGITEAENGASELYGIERLCAVLAAHRQDSAEELKQAVITDLFQFINGHTVFDDITLLVVKKS